MSEKQRKKAARRLARKSESTRRPRVTEDAQGRTHLVLVPSEPGQPPRLAFGRLPFHEEWQNGVALAAANTTRALLGSPVTLEEVVRVARRAMDATSRLVDGFLAHAPAGALACRAGCGHCCHHVVGATAPEIFAIFDYLKSTLEPGELAVAAARVRDAARRAAGLSADERVSPELPCPFLAKERCSVYEVRPLACRGKTSLDAGVCERTLRDSEARAAYLDGSLSVPCFVEPLRAFHAVSAGVQLAFAELCGLVMAPLELKAAMAIVLDDPQGTQKAWLSGGDPFLAAQGAADGTADRRGHELSGRRS